jgi:hypothetical protein
MADRNAQQAGDGKGRREIRADDGLAQEDGRPQRIPPT